MMIWTLNFISVSSEVVVSICSLMLKVSNPCLGLKPLAEVLFENTYDLLTIYLSCMWVAKLSSHGTSLIASLIITLSDLNLFVASLAFITCCNIFYLLCSFVVVAIMLCCIARGHINVKLTTFYMYNLFRCSVCRCHLLKLLFYMYDVLLLPG